MALMGQDGQIIGRQPDIHRLPRDPWNIQADDRRREGMEQGREVARSMDPVNRGLVGTVQGLNNLGRGLGIVAQADDEEKAKWAGFQEEAPWASIIGEGFGEAMPVLPFGFGIAGVSSKLARVALEGLLGGTEAFLASKGRGETAKQQATMTGLGTGAGLAAETVVPPVAKAVIKGGKKAGKALLSELSEMAMSHPGMVSNIVEPQRAPLGQAAFDEMWGKTKPTETQFKEVDRLAELRQKVSPAPDSPERSKGVYKVGPKKGEPKPVPATAWEEIQAEVDEIAKDHADNPAAREISSLYERTDTGLDDIEKMYTENLTKDADGQDIFTKIHNREMSRRGEAVQKGYKSYGVEGIPIQKSASSGKANRKVGDEYMDADTSKGCIGNCPECYAAYGGATQSKKCFLNPQPMRLTGHFSNDKETIRRIGTNGEPNMNPIEFRDSPAAEEFRNKLAKGENVSPQELDDLIEDTYDWGYTNEQIVNTGLDSDGVMKGKKYVPGGKDMTFFISKFQTLKNFDPNIVKNVEVSLDPQTPSHFFKALKNIERVQASGADTNFMLRIRSMSTQSDEINALQKMAVDFANKHDIPVLETRVRFKKRDTAAMAQLQDEYYFQGGAAQTHILLSIRSAWLASWYV